MDGELLDVRDWNVCDAMCGVAKRWMSEHGYRDALLFATASGTLHISELELGERERERENVEVEWCQMFLNSLPYPIAMAVGLN